MKAIGIDTVILIRAGYREMATFDSRVLRERMGILPVREDLVDLFLREAERCGMAFYFGTYDSGRHWVGGDHAKEVDVNRPSATRWSSATAPAPPSRAGTSATRSTPSTRG